MLNTDKIKGWFKKKKNPRNSALAYEAETIVNFLRGNISEEECSKIRDQLKPLIDTEPTNQCGERWL